MKTIIINKNVNISKIIEDIRGIVIFLTNIENLEKMYYFQKSQERYFNHLKELEKQERLNEWLEAEKKVNEKREKKRKKSWNIKGNLIIDMLKAHENKKKPKSNQCDQDSDRLTNLPVRALRMIAGKIKVKGFSRMKKDILVKNINKTIKSKGIDQELIENQIYEYFLEKRTKYYQKQGKEFIESIRLARNDIEFNYQFQD